MRAARGKKGEIVSWLFIAYAIVWAAFFIYLFALQRKMASVAQRFDELNK